MSLNNEYTTVENRGGDTPSRYTTLDGFETTTVAFGSDAPQLTNFSDKILCGPGTILVAHTADEYIKVSDIEIAVDNYVKMFENLSNKQ
jgi:acetylornithine deacetylase